jgi:hypothetical protein
MTATPETLGALLSALHAVVDVTPDWLARTEAEPVVGA